MKIGMICVAVMTAGLGSLPLLAGAHFVPSEGCDCPAAQSNAHEHEMSQHMKAMKAQMDQIRRASDPKKRDRLVAEHLRSVRERMLAMHEAGDGAMMQGHGMMGGRADADGAPMMKGCMEMMQKMEQMHGHAAQPGQPEQAPPQPQAGKDEHGH